MRYAFLCEDPAGIPKTSLSEIESHQPQLGNNLSFLNYTPNEWQILETYASWIASAATMLAAMMTAANLGTRVTGWGFVVFTVGSIAWAIVGLVTGQTSLFVTNAFLFAVNLFGVWRWLGKQARYEQGSTAATHDSHRQRHAPTLFSGGGLIGSKIDDADGRSLGTIVDTMLSCDTKNLAYVVVARGGMAGAGETLRAISPLHFAVDVEGVRCTLTTADFERLLPIDEDQWPAVAPEPVEAAPVMHAAAERERT